ncbi:MAG: hypothetical protein SF123_02425 [Chloroflexota bacterium]|nr:hypothetical protein [Chloroflexota bacterium]
MTRLETDNWDPSLDLIGNPLASVTQRGQQLTGSIASQTYPFQWIFEQAEILAYGRSPRVAGAALGVPNIYIPQVDEAWSFHGDYELLNLESLRTERGILSYFPRDVNEDPFFAMRAFGLVLNWIGARQQINIGAGATDRPAIHSGTTDLASQFTRPASDISAFSLAVTRYTDAVDAVPFADIFSSDRFGMMISAVEGIDDAAHQLGVDVVIGEDFVPYTPRQARDIVETLKGLDPNDDRRIMLCDSSMLQLAYEQAEGRSALENALTSVGC